MIIRREKISRKLLTIILCVTIFLTACQTNVDETDFDHQNASKTNDSEDLDINKISQSDSNESDILNLYLQTRDTYNPLDRFDYSGRAIYSLLYRSLFTLDSENILRKDLVENANYNSSKNSYEIELNSENTFSNQEIIDSNDCKASILAYRDYLEIFLEERRSSSDPSIYTAEISDSSGEEADAEDTNTSTYLIAEDSDETVEIDLLENELLHLNQISEINISDEKKFEIVLNETTTTQTYLNTGQEENINGTGTVENIDPGLLFSLTMPIIKHEDVGKTDFLSITSGNYNFAEKNEAGILLEANKPEISLQKILLMEFDNCKEAILALENKQIDMVYVDEENFNLFGKQNSRKIISFPGQKYYYLKFGENDTINDPEFRSALEQIWIIRDDLVKNLVGYQTLSELPLQYNDAAISKFNLLKNVVEQNNFDSYFKSQETNPIIVKLIAPNLVTEQEFALEIREELLRYNIDVEIELIDEELYQAALDGKNYDLAINSINLNYPMFLFDTFQKISPDYKQNLTDDEQQLHNLLLQYFNTIDRQLDPKVYEDNFNNIQSLILDNFDELEILGIGFLEVGILMSNQIENVPNSNISNPYNRLEDIWVHH
ncbi:MAG: hypothetical protein GX326_06155 [Clostridiaceae bacterium]|nr:hypothetical protein [Clostridiaceae bacterium]